MARKKSEKSVDADRAKGRLRSQPSSHDVARLAGVSQAAVSRSFTEGASVSEKTKAKVMKAARELGYYPNILPRILATHSSQLVAIVIGGMYNPYYSKVFEQFTRRFQEEGYQVLVFFVDHNEHFDDAIPMIMRYRVDGIISALSLLSTEAADECAQMQVPIVTFNGRRQAGTVSSVCCDNAEGGRQIATLLQKRGGKRFAMIEGRESVANADRKRGFLTRLEELGIDDVQTVQGDFHYEGGFAAAKILFSQVNRPDAVFCANDLMAMGAVQAAESEFGLKVPRDVRIAGFDDAAFSNWPCAGLTTIRQDSETMVERSIGILKSYWKGEVSALGGLEVVPGELIERSSTSSKT